MLVKADTKKKETSENLLLSDSVPKFNRTGLNRTEKNREGVPDPKKFERTGKDSFVIHADKNNYFEGVVTDPKRVKIKDSGRIIMTNVGVCIRKCVNKDKKCNACWRFSNYVEEN